MSPSQALETLQYVGIAYFYDYDWSEDPDCLRTIRDVFENDPEFRRDVFEAFETAISGQLGEDELRLIVLMSFNRPIFDLAAARTYICDLHKALFG